MADERDLQVETNLRRGMVMGRGVAPVAEVTPPATPVVTLMERVNWRGIWIGMFVGYISLFILSSLSAAIVLSAKGGFTRGGPAFLATYVVVGVISAYLAGVVGTWVTHFGRPAICAFQGFMVDVVALSLPILISLVIGGLRGAALGTFLIPATPATARDAWAILITLVVGIGLGALGGLTVSAMRSGANRNLAENRPLA